MTGQNAMTQDTTDPTTFDIDEWIAGATRPETVVMLSSKGREYGEFKAKEQELLAAQKAAADDHDDRLVSVGTGDAVRIATEMDALAKVIEKGRRPFRLRGLSDDDLKLVRETTKTEKLDDDATNELILSLACIDPVLSREKWRGLRNALGEGQFVQAIRAANQVSFGEAVDVPFSVAASVALATQES